MTRLKVYQLNHNRRWDAHEMLEQIAKSNKRGIILGQEPNVRKARTLDADEKVDCFIQMVGIDERPRRWIRGKGYIGVEVGDAVLVSAYFSPNGQDDDFVELLDGLEQIVSTRRRVLIGGDLNARTESIGDKKTSTRGQVLEEWLAKNNLIIINIPGIALQ